jgi:Fe-S-cluster containining protein
MTVPRHRPCGSCSECCVLLSIKAPKLKKPMLTPCPHLAAPGPGCGIYRNRPRICRGYSCAWRDGLVEEQFSPDATGIVADWYALPGALGLTLHVDPSRHDSDALEALIAGLPATFTEVKVVYVGHHFEWRSRTPSGLA